MSQKTIDECIEKIMYDEKEKERWFKKHAPRKIACVVGKEQNKVLFCFSKDFYQYGVDDCEKGWLMFLEDDKLLFRINDKNIVCEVGKEKINSIRKVLNTVFLCSYNIESTPKERKNTLKNAWTKIIDALKDNKNFKKIEYMKETPCAVFWLSN